VGQSGGGDVHRGEPPRVSLIMPAWRPRPDWLRVAVASALEEPDCEVELLVVDDGSPTPVAELLADVEDPRVAVIRVEHGGVSRARNAGIAVATGDFFRFIDADDAYQPGSTARLVQLCSGKSLAMAYGATVFCDENLRPLWKMTSSLEGRVEQQALLGRFFIRPQSVLFTRGLVERTGEWDPSFTVSEDWDYLVRALELAPVRGHRRPATFYRRHRGAATDDVTAGAAGARLVVERYFDRHPERRDGLQRAVSAMLHATQARAYALNGQPFRAAASAARALLLDPAAPAAEARQALPAARGYIRRSLTPR